MQNYSLTYTGVIVSILGFLLAKAGIAYNANELTQIVANSVVVAGWITTLYGRYRVGGITVCGIKL